MPFFNHGFVPAALMIMLASLFISRAFHFMKQRNKSSKFF